MTKELKTLKNFRIIQGGQSIVMGDKIEVGKHGYLIEVDELVEEAIRWIRANQTGKGVNRDIIPENMRGKLAKKLWNDNKFTLGFEYGAIAMLMKFFDIREELK